MSHRVGISATVLKTRVDPCGSRPNVMLESNKLETSHTALRCADLAGHAQNDASHEIWNRFFESRPSVEI